MYPIFVRFLSEFLVFFLLIPAVYLLVKKDINILIKILLSVVITYLLRKITGTILYEPRPYIVDPAIIIYPFHRLPDSSFFSTHASVSMAFAASVFFRYKRLGTLLVIGSFLVALGRVLGGLHYYHDVTFGLLVGFVVAFLINKYYQHWKNYLVKRAGF